MAEGNALKIGFHTFGCKVNQFDTAAMKEQASEASHEIVAFDQKADVYVINTCTVTEKSDNQSRQLIRKVLRRNPEAKIVVTGCYAQTNPDALVKIKGVNLVLGTQERGNWLDMLGGCDRAVGPLKAVDPTFSEGPLDQPLIHRFGERTRAFIKVQDGCDARCSFCVIPRARGNSRSLPVDHVIEQIRQIVLSGYKEVVLTGVNLGFYGRDFTPKYSLAQIIRRILDESDLPRLRISSLEPKTITKELVTIVTSSNRICRHLHIPLQSGDDSILKRMNRHYTSSYYQRQITSLCEQIPDLCVGTDVMVGFPGESDTAFRNTQDLLNQLPFGYFHVFTYSPRTQTVAELMDSQIVDSIKMERSKILRALGEEKKKDFRKRYQGHQLMVLVEEEREKTSGFLQGYTDNYIKVYLRGPDHWKNRLMPVLVQPGKPDFLGFRAEKPVFSAAKEY